MGIERIRNLAGPYGCQHDNGEQLCLREQNATVHRENFGGENHEYHEYVAPLEEE